MLVNSNSGPNEKGIHNPYIHNPCIFTAKKSNIYMNGILVSVIHTLHTSILKGHNSFFTIY